MAHILVEIVVRGVFKLVGLDSPFSSSSYGPNWSKQRRKCLKRDGYQCRVCGKSNGEMDREPAVHHITPRQQFDDGEWGKMNATSNLVTLCHSCHGKYEGDFVGASPQEFASKAGRKNS